MKKSTQRGGLRPPQLLLAGAGVTMLLLAGCASSPPTTTTTSHLPSKKESRPVQTDGAPTHRVDFAAIPDAVPRAEPLSRWGNRPYRVHGKAYQVLKSSDGFVQRGLASWYGTKYHGRQTSNGEVYDMYAMTGAHNSLPLPSFVRVTNLENGRNVVVRINDRGPFHGNRVLDLSYAAAGKLGMLGKGVASVEIRALTPSGVRHASSRPTPVPRSSAQAGREGYTLQVGAFSDRDNAHSLRADLESALGYTIQVRPGNSGPRPIYRVQIGPLEPHDAERATYRLAQLGYTDTRVIFD